MCGLSFFGLFRFFRDNGFDGFGLGDVTFAARLRLVLGGVVGQWFGSGGATGPDFVGDVLALMSEIAERILEGCKDGNEKKKADGDGADIAGVADEEFVEAMAVSAAPDYLRVSCVGDESGDDGEGDGKKQ